MNSCESSKNKKAIYNKLNAEHQRLIEHFHDNFTLAKNEFMISWATAYMIQFPAVGNSTPEAKE